MFNIEKIPAVASIYGVSWTSRLLGLILAGFSGSVFLGITRFLGVQGLYVSVGLFCTGTACGYIAWMLSCRIPRNRPGMIGIALAIKTETQEEQLRIRADFIQEIGRCLGKNELRPFYVYEIPGHLAPDINDIEGAGKFLRKSRGHLLLWGSIRTRSKSKVETYCLKLDGVVTHSIIEHERSKIFSQDMRLAIPEKTEISLANELRGFESTSQTISIGAQYIVAIAAAISGDWLFSEVLLLELKNRTCKNPTVRSHKAKKKTSKSEMTEFQKLIPLRLAEVCLAHCHWSIQQWQNNKKDTSLLTRAEVSLENYLNALNRIENHAYWINKALLEVSLRRDIVAAERMLIKCRAVAINDPTWRLSLAFISVLKGDVLEAINLYDAALERHVPAEMLMNIEDYVQWWLDTHNGPPALYLLSAMLNAHGKCDKHLALTDLATFEALNPTLGAALKLRVCTLRSELELPDSSGNDIKNESITPNSVQVGVFATA